MQVQQTCLPCTTGACGNSIPLVRRLISSSKSNKMRSGNVGRMLNVRALTSSNEGNDVTTGQHPTWQNGYWHTTPSSASSITISEGDSVWNLAMDMNTTVEHLQALNPGVDLSDVFVGQKIAVPQGTAAPPTPRAASPVVYVPPRTTTRADAPPSPRYAPGTSSQLAGLQGGAVLPALGFLGAFGVAGARAVLDMRRGKKTRHVQREAAKAPSALVGVSSQSEKRVAEARCQLAWQDWLQQSERAPAVATRTHASRARLATLPYLHNTADAADSEMHQIQASWRATATSNSSIATMQRSIYSSAGSNASSPLHASQTQPQQELVQAKEEELRVVRKAAHDMERRMNEQLQQATDLSQALQQQVEDLHKNLQAQKQRAQRDSRVAWADSAENAMVTEQVMQAQRKVKGLMRELSELQQQSHANLASQHVAGVEAGRQAQALQVQVTTLERNLEAEKMLVEALQEYMSSLEKELAQAIRESGTAVAEEARGKKAAQAVATQREKELGQAGAELARLKTTLGGLREDIKALQAEVESKTALVRRMEQERRGMAEAVAALTAEREDLQATLQGAQEALAEAQAQLTAARAETTGGADVEAVAALEARVEALGKEKAELMEQLAANETKHRQELAEASSIFERTMKRSRAQVAELKKEVASLRQALAEQESGAGGARAALSEAEARLEESARTHAEATRKAAILMKQNGALESDKRRAVQLADARLKDVQKTQAETAEVRRALLAAEAELASTRALAAERDDLLAAATRAEAVASSQAAVQREMQRMDAAGMKVAAALALSEMDVCRLEEHARDADAKMLQMRKALQRMNVVNAELSEQLNGKQNALSELEDRVKSKEQEMRRLVAATQCQLAHKDATHSAKQELALAADIEHKQLVKQLAIKQHTVQQMQSQVEQLRSQCAAVNGRMMRAEAANAQLMQRMQSRAEADSKSQQVQDAESRARLERAEKAHQETAALLAGKESELRDLAGQLEAARAESEARGRKAEDALAHVEEQRRELQSARANSHAREFETEAKLQIVEKKRAEATAKLKESQQEVADLAARLEQGAVDMARSQTAASSQLDAVHAEMRRMDTAHARAVAALAEKEQEVRELAAKLEAEQEELRRGEREAQGAAAAQVESARGEVARISGAHAQAVAQLAEKEAKVLALSLQLEKAAEMLTIAQQHNSGDFASTHKVLQRMDGAYAQAAFQLAEREAEVKSLEAALKATAQELSSQREETSAAEASVRCKEAELEAMQGEVAAMAAANKKAAGEVRRMDAAHARTEEQQRRLADSLAHKQAEVAALTVQLEEMELEVAALATSSKMGEAQREAQSSELRSVQGQHEDLVQRLTRAEATAAELQAELEAVGEERDQLQADLAVQVATVDRLEQQMPAMRHQMENMLQRYSANQETVERTQSAVASLQRKLDERDEEVRKLQALEEESQVVVQEAAGERERHQRAAEEACEELVAAEAAAASLRAQLQHLQHTAAADQQELQKEVARLQQELERATSRAEVSTQTLEETNGRVRDFERRRLEAEASNQKLGFELKQAKARVGDLGGALVQAHAAAAEALNSSRDARDDLKIASQQVTSLEGQLEAAQRVESELRATVSRLEEELLTTSQNMRHVMDQETSLVQEAMRESPETTMAAMEDGDPGEAVQDARRELELAQERLVLRERAWEDLMATTRKLEEEKQQASAHILDLEEEVLAATTALQTAEQYIETVERSEATLTDQIVTREQAVQEMLRLVQQQEDHRQAMESKMHKLEEEKIRIEAQLAEAVLDHEDDAAQHASDLLSLQLSAKSAEAQALQRAGQQRKAQLENAQTQAKKIQEEKEALEQQLSVLQGELANAKLQDASLRDSDVSGLQEMLAEKEDALRSARQVAENKKTQQMEVLQQLKSLEHDRDGLKNQVEDLKVKLIQARMEIEKAQRNSFTGMQTLKKQGSNNVVPFPDPQQSKNARRGLIGNIVRGLGFK